MTPQNELTSILHDALSLKLFGKNVNPNPSQAWMNMATEQEIAEWQHGDAHLEALLAERIRIEEEVKNYTLEMMEEDMGIRHLVPNLEEDLSPFREIPIESFTRQRVKNQGGRSTTCCVFHEDKNPSCSLYGTQGYYCWSCGAHGNAIDWCMRENSYTFAQAIDYLKRLAY